MSRRLAEPHAVLTAALGLAASGWPVFPCVPGMKRPLTRHGLLDATTDTQQIRWWWEHAPTANLAIPTGAATVDVLDIDRRPGGSGYSAITTLAEAGLLEDYIRAVATPSGGMHLYFPGTTQPSGRLPEKFIDFKASGGYVLVPPSVVDGASYADMRIHARVGRPLDWPALRRLLAPPAPARPAGPHQVRTGTTSVQVLAAWVSTLPEGRRNNGTFWAACRAAEEGHTDLRAIVHAAVRAGLPEIEAHRTVASAQRMVARTRHDPPRPPSPSTAVRGRR